MESIGDGKRPSSSAPDSEATLPALATVTKPTSARPRPRRQSSRFEPTPDLDVCRNGIAHAAAEYRQEPLEQLASVDQTNEVGSGSVSGVTTVSRSWGDRIRTGIRFRTLHFTPSWFAVNMGTGKSSHSQPPAFHF